MAYPDEALAYRIRIAPDADLTADPSSYSWTEITSDVSFSRRFPFVIKAGADDEEQEGDSELGLVLRNFAEDNGKRSSLTQIDGRYTIGNPNSDLYDLGFDLGCPVELAVDFGTDVSPTWHTLAVQYLAAESPSWPGMSGNMPLAAFELGGLLRRLQRGSDPMSALRRTLAGPNEGLHPTDVWLMESADVGTAQVASWPSATGGAAASSSPAYPGIAETVLGAQAAPEWYGRFNSWEATINSPSTAMSTADAWTFGWAMRLVPREGDTEAVHSIKVRLDLGGVSASSGYIECELGFRRATGGAVDDDNSNAILTVYDVNGTAVSTGTSADATTGRFNPFDGVARYYEIAVARLSAFLYDIYLLVDGETKIVFAVALGTAWPAAATIGREGSLSVSSVVTNNTGIAWAMNHVYCSNTQTGYYTGSYGLAALAYVGEQAHQRTARLCGEENVPVRLYDEDNYSQDMGPQLVASLVPLLRECEKAELGILDDHLGYINLITAGEMTAVEPWLTLDGSNRELYFPFAPTSDDQRLNNDHTASANGLAYRATDEAHIARAGRYSSSSNPNVEGLSGLSAHAGFAVASGTVRTKRVPQITIDFLRSPELIATWLAAGNILGKRIDLTNQPRSQTPDDLQQQIRGFTLTLTGRRAGARLEMNTIPYEPWRAGSWGDDTDDSEGTGTSGDEGLRLDNAACSLDDPIDADDVTFDVTSDLVPWINGEASVLDDVFAVASSSLWPNSPPNNSAWTFTGGSNGDYQTGAFLGYATSAAHILATAGSERICRSNAVGANVDHVVYSQHRWGVATAAVAELMFSHYVWFQDFSNYIEVNCYLMTDGAIEYSVWRTLAGVRVNLVAQTELPGHGAGSYIANDDLSMISYIREGGGTKLLDVSLWSTGELGGSWPPIVRDVAVGASVPKGQYCAVASLRVTGNTDANAVSAWGRIRLGSSLYDHMFPFDIEVGGEQMRVESISGTGLAQTMTVERSQNTVSKSHAAGRGVRLWHPKRVAFTGPGGSEV